MFLQSQRGVVARYLQGGAPSLASLPVNAPAIAGGAGPGPMLEHSADDLRVIGALDPTRASPAVNTLVLMNQRLDRSLLQAATGQLRDAGLAALVRLEHRGGDLDGARHADDLLAPSQALVKVLDAERTCKNGCSGGARANSPTRTRTPGPGSLRSA